MNLISTYKRRVLTFNKADLETKKLLIRHRYMPVVLNRVTYPIRLLLAIILRIVLVTLKPIVHFRFAPLDSSSLGGFAIPTELYLCEKATGVQPRRSTDIFYHHDRDAKVIFPEARASSLICNEQLDHMFRNKLKVHKISGFLDHLNRLIPAGRQPFMVQPTDAFDRHGYFEKIPKQTEFTTAEEERGLECLESMGIDPNEKFVCFFARDLTYFNRTRPRITQVFGEWADSSYRNATINNYLQAAERMTELGYYSIRMGKFAGIPIHSSNPKVIDYAINSQSDFMDVYLASKCKFFLAHDAGMTALPTIFRTPIAFANVFPYDDIHLSAIGNSLFTPKKLFSRKYGRLLSLDEVLSDPLLFAYSGTTAANNKDHYENIGLEIQENTPDEIEALAIEMEDRLNNTYEETTAVVGMREQFFSIINAHSEKFPTGSSFDFRRFRIGSHFLKKYPEWLAT